MKKYLFIFFIIIISLLFSGFLVKNVFLANTPKINPFFANNISKRISNNLSSISKLFTFKNNNIASSNKEEVTLKNNLKVILNKTSAGVYAGEKNNIKVVKIKTNEIEWLEYTFNIKGKEIKIKVRKGDNPPKQELLEQMY